MEQNRIRAAAHMFPRDWTTKRMKGQGKQQDVNAHSGWGSKEQRCHSWQLWAVAQNWMLLSPAVIQNDLPDLLPAFSRAGCRCSNSRQLLPLCQAVLPPSSLEYLALPSLSVGEETTQKGWTGCVTRKRRCWDLYI